MKRILLSVLVIGILLLSACAAPPVSFPKPEQESLPIVEPEPSTEAISEPEQAYQQHFEQGNIYLEQEQWDKAIAEFDEVIDCNPKFEEEAAARVGRGIANAWAGNFKQAENDLNMSYDSFGSADAYIAFGIAMTAQHSGSFDEAESLFSTAISLDPNNPDAYTGRALWYLQEAYIWGVGYETSGAANLRWAISDFEKAIELDSRDIQGRIERFNFQDEMAFLPNYIKANKQYGALLVDVSGYRYYDDALEVFARVLEVAPKDVEALIGRGNAYMGLGQYDKAIPSFNVALELAPYNADAYAGRAIAYTKDEQYDLAIADFEKAIELDDGYGQGKYDDAYTTPGRSADYNRKIVIGFAQSFVGAYTSRGYAHLDNGEYDLAIDDFTKAITFQPDRSYFGSHYNETDKIYVYAHTGRGISYTRTKEYKKAIDDFNRANLSDYGFERNYPNPFKTPSQQYIARAIAYAGAGYWEMAFKDFAEVERYDDWGTYMDANAYVIRGEAYLHHLGSGSWWNDIYMGNDVIQRSFGKAIELDPNNAEAYIGRGITNELMDENDKAVDDFRIAVEIAPSEFERYAKKYLALIRRDLPTHSFNMAIALDSNNAEAYLGRALCYVSGGFVIDTDSKPSWDLHDLVFADFDMALKLDPNLTRVYLARASFYTARASEHGEMSDIEKAMAELERVTESAPTDEERQEALDLIEELREVLALWYPRP